MRLQISAFAISLPSEMSKERLPTRKTDDERSIASRDTLEALKAEHDLVVALARVVSKVNLESNT